MYFVFSPPPPPHTHTIVSMSHPRITAMPRTQVETPRDKLLSRGDGRHLDHLPGAGRGACTQ